MLLVFIVVGTYSIIKALYSLQEPGLGQEVRNKVIKRHISFVLVILISNLPRSLLSLFILFSSDFFKLNTLNSQTVERYNRVDMWVFIPI